MTDTHTNVHTNDHTTVYLCEDTPDGIFTGVYDTWTHYKSHQNMHLQADNVFTYQLFCDYIHIPVDYEKSGKVARSVKRKISPAAWEMVFKASLSNAVDKGDAILHFLDAGFHYGKEITDMLALDEVQRIFELHRKVSNESHYFLEFLRFAQLDNGILFSRIKPKVNVLPLISHHFADRLSCENWMIWDENRNWVSMHEKGKNWILSEADPQFLSELQRKQTDEYAWNSLWRTFHRTISIQERTNEDCQRTHLPLWYRRNMTEFM